MKQPANRGFLILVLLASVISFVGLYYYHKGHSAIKGSVNRQEMNLRKP